MVCAIGDSFQYLALALLPSEVWSIQQQLRAACICFFLWLLRGVILSLPRYMFLICLIIAIMVFSVEKDSGCVNSESDQADSDHASTR